jgi:glucan phosphoethanolaminetransferase (alkaline phosphatase superfamily)
VTFKAVDKNGNIGFLQVVSVVSGQTATNKTNSNQTVVTKTRILWWPVLLMFVPVLSSFWLGRRYELVALRKRLEREYR